MSDLVRARYGVSNPVWNITGRPNNVAQSNLALRSNTDGFGQFAGITDAAAALTTAVSTTVGVPVQVGDIISTVSVRVGATAAVTPTNQWAAVYAGLAIPTLLAQSTDTTSAAINASSTLTYTLATPQVVTQVNAPNGYWYVSIMVKAGTVPSLASFSIATAVAGPWFTGAATPCQTNGTALSNTAPGTVAAGTAQATVPVVWLG